MTDQPANISLRLSTDEQALNRSQQGISLLSQRLQNLRKDAQDAGTAIDKSAGSFGQSSVLLDRLAASAENAAKKAKQAAGDWNDLRNSVMNAGQAGAATGGSTFGVEGLRRTGGALSQLGLGAIGGPVSKIGDIAQVGKELGSVSNALTEMSGATGPAIAGLSAGTVALGALAAAGLVFVGGLALIKEAYKDAGRAAEEAVSRLDTYYQALESGDAEAIKKKKQQLEITKQYTDEELAVLKTAKEQGFEAAQKAYGDFGARILEGLGATGLYGDGIKKVDEQIDKLTKSSDDLTGQIKGLTDAYNSQAIQAQLATEAVLKNAQDARQKTAEEQADAALSLDAAKAKLKAQQDLLQQENAELFALQASGDQSQKTKDRIAELVKELSDTSDEITKLNEQMIPYLQGLKDHADALNNANKAAVEAGKNDKAIADNFKKYKDDVASIEQKSAEQQAAIHQKLADTLVSEARKMVEQAQDDLQKLQDKRAELFTNYQRTEADNTRKQAFDDLETQIKAQQDEAKAYQDHLSKLEDIRRSSWADEQQALLDRNFVALAKSRLNVVTQMQNENISFGRSQGEQSKAQQETKADNERQRAFERQERLIAYQNANEDAQHQYQIELRDQKIAHDRAVQLAQQTAQNELQLEAQKRDAALKIRAQTEQAELKLMLQGGDARIKAEAAVQQALINQALQFAATGSTRFGGTGGSSMSLGLAAHRAFGGPLSAGQPSEVNELGNRESFAGQLLPGGRGLFIPFQSGNVSSGGVNLTQNISIPSGVNNPQQIVKMIRDETLNLLEKVI